MCKPVFLENAESGYTIFEQTSISQILVYEICTLKLFTLLSVGYGSSSTSQYHFSPTFSPKSVIVKIYKKYSIMAGKPV